MLEHPLTTFTRNTMNRSRSHFQSVLAHVASLPAPVNNERQTWAQIGHWDIRPIVINDQLRYIRFANNAQNALVTNVFLCEFTNGEFRITLQIANSNYRRFRDGIAPTLLSLNVIYNDSLCQISLQENRSSSSRLYCFILFCASVEASLTELAGRVISLINESIFPSPQPRLPTVHENDQDLNLQNRLNRSFEEYYGHTNASYRPSQSASPISLPDPGENAKALDTLDVEVPEHLTCKLSLQIMTDPVRFEGIANRECFEYAWIKEHLRKHNTHPITREKVTEAQLISSLPVKRECDRFTRAQMKNTSTVTLK